MASDNGKPPAWYLNKMFKKTRKEELYAWLDPSGIYADRDVSLRAGVCRPCVETELTATKKSATDGN